jgi:hypothetical protein
MKTQCRTHWRHPSAANVRVFVGHAEGVTWKEFNRDLGPGDGCAGTRLRSAHHKRGQKGTKSRLIWRTMRVDEASQQMRDKKDRC